MDRRGPTRHRSATIRHLRPILGLLVTGLMLVGAPVGPVASATTTDPLVVASLASDGRYLEAAGDSELESAADRANAAGVAFVWLDRSGDESVAVTLADEYVEELGVAGSPYQTVLVVIGNGFAASSLTWSQAELDRGLDAAFVGFAAGDMTQGLDDFVAALPGGGGTTATTTGTGAGTTATDGGDSGGGIGLGSILLVLAVAGGGFLLVRRFLRGRREREQAEIDLADDRAEIEEQLKNNADRVIALGDRVIASGDRELIVLYEEASAAYQDVSQRVDGATSAAEIDELDDRIDHAEWQFEVIEATLDGRPRPQPPSPDPEPELPAPGDRADRANAGAEDRIDDGRRRLPEPPVVTSPRTGRTYPRSTGRTRQRGGRGGGLGGALGGGLGGVLADIVLGGGLGGGLGGRSRRSRRRTTTGSGLGRSTRGGGLGGGGLGGGVLRRGGSSGSTRNRRPTPRSSGGRSTGGRSRSRGGRRI